MLSLSILPLLFLSGAPPAERPDVVVFMIDDVADSDIDAIPTPNLDRLAAEGVRFRRAYSHAWCSPTRDALMRSAWLGRDHGDACLPAGASTLDTGVFDLPKLFEGQGYHTAHLGKWHLGSNSLGPWEMTAHLLGFDHVRAGIPIGTCDPFPRGWARLDDGVVTNVFGDRTIALRDAFEEWWSSLEGPRFAMVNFSAAHRPFIFPPQSILPPRYPRPQDPTNREAYEAEVVGVDFVIGQLLPVLGPDTWVVFLGDNGTPGAVPGMPLGETDATRRDQDPTRVKLTCYEDGVRVPLIIRGPGVLAGKDSQDLVHVVDLLPTFAEILGVPLLAPVDGVSFAPALHGGAGVRDFVYVHSPPRRDCAVIQRRWKLLTDSKGREELYDLQTDPREEHPLAPIGPVANRLRLLRASIQVEPPEHQMAPDSASLRDG
jgi:arylsulfatase A-like enzyme